MSEEPTLKQFNFLKSKGKYVEGMTKQQAHDAIALIIPAKVVPQTPPMAEIVKNEQGEIAEVVPMNPEEKPKKSYELTDGNIRIGALNAAIKVSEDFSESGSKQLIEIAKEFEEYIRNGK